MNDNNLNSSSVNLFNLPAIARTVALLAAASVIGYLFDWLQAPLGWLLGPLIMGVGYAISQKNTQLMSPVFSIIGQAVLGISVASQFS